MSCLQAGSVFEPLRARMRGMVVDSLDVFPWFTVEPFKLAGSR